MAILEKIRNRAGVFIMVFVGVALFLFIVDPSTFDSMFRQNPTSIAKIAGTDVPYDEFVSQTNMHENWLKIAQRKSSIDAETMSQVKEQTWNDLIRKYVLEENFEDFGITVSPEEQEDLLWGNHIHEIIKSNFTSPETNQLDTSFVQNYFRNADQDPSGQQEFIATYLTAMIVKDRAQTKYDIAISKGLYVPTFMAEEDYYAKNNNVSFASVRVNFNSLKDDEFEVSEQEITNYYNENLEKFQVKEANREIEYIAFNVKPSGADSTDIYKNVEILQVQLSNSQTPKQFINQNSDYPYVESFVKADEINPSFKESFFTSEIGTVSPIYFEDGAYNVSKILERKEMPDSTMASHILIIPDSTKSLTDVQATIDSLKILVDNGADFAQLAKEFSQDPGSGGNGGDLGWFPQGAMVPAFNNVCFNNPVGAVVSATSNFGVHLIKITDQTEYNEVISLATVKKDIHYSTETYQRTYGEASAFSADAKALGFSTAVTEKKLVKRIANAIKEYDEKISGLENPRSIIRWTFEDEVKINDVSDVFELTDIFVVANLTNINEKGNADLEDVKSQIEPIVLKQKKADKIISEIADMKDLNAIANKYSVKIDTSDNINLNSFSIPRYGIEPNVIATVVELEENVTSAPIKGNNGVYIVNVINKSTVSAKEDYSKDKLNLMAPLASRAPYSVFEALKENAQIEDLRSIWF